MWRTLVRAVKGTPTHWVDDTASPGCTRCKEAWSVTNRRHHCRVCGELVCGKCWVKIRGMRCLQCDLLADAVLWGPYCVTVGETNAVCRAVFNEVTDRMGVTRVYVVASDTPAVLPIGAWLLAVGTRAPTLALLRKPAALPKPFVCTVLPQARACLVFEIYTDTDLQTPMYLERRRAADDTNIDSLHYALDDWSLRCLCDGPARRWVVRRGGSKIARSTAMTADTIRLPQDVKKWEAYNAAKKSWAAVETAFLATDADVRVGAKVAVLHEVAPRRVWVGGTVEAFDPRYTGAMVTVRYDAGAAKQETIHGRCGRVFPEVPMGPSDTPPSLQRGARARKRSTKSGKKERRGERRGRRGSSGAQPPPPPQRAPITDPPPRGAPGAPTVQTTHVIATPPGSPGWPPPYSPHGAGAGTGTPQHVGAGRRHPGGSSSFAQPPPSMYTPQQRPSAAHPPVFTPDTSQLSSVTGSFAESTADIDASSDDDDELLGSLTSHRARPHAGRRPPSAGLHSSYSMRTPTPDQMSMYELRLSRQFTPTMAAAVAPPNHRRQRTPTEEEP